MGAISLETDDASKPNMIASWVVA